MKNKKVLKLILIPVAIVVLAITAIVVVKVISSNQTSKFDNEVNELVFSTLEVDKVFNPFFSTSGTDSNVVGMTQIGMLGNDKDGNYTYGDNEAVITKDIEIKTEGTTKDVDLFTTYYFVLKNNVRFSNGSYLTIKDVLFNYYVYLDPVYSGSSTIYSTDIVGLKEYRTQQTDELEQDAFMVQFQNDANTRLDSLLQAKEEIYEAHESENITAEKFREYLVAYQEENNSEAYANLVKDYDKALEFFKEELNNDYTNSMNSYHEQKFYDESDNEVPGKVFTTDVEMFLYNEGYITWNKKDKEFTCSFGTMEQAKTYTKEQAINFVYMDNIPSKLNQVITGWVTATTLFDYMTNDAMEAHFNSAERPFPNISGIKFANKDEAVVVNGVTYNKPTYTDGVIDKDSYEVLSIKIKNIDPKAIWNFALGIAPMYYYSSQEEIEKFDFESNFGVKYGSQTFMNEVVKDPNKIGVPVGAGAYAASKASGGIENVKSGDFYDKGVIYFERNPYFFKDSTNPLVGPAKIKKVRFQVVSSQQMLNTLYNNAVDFVEPNAKPETIAELDSKKSQGIGNRSIRTSGYGYIGINAGKVPSIKVRQAIMHAINTELCVEYYQNTAEAIYRPMSKASWVYNPKAEGSNVVNEADKYSPTAYYPFIGGKVPSDLSVVNPDYKDYVESLGKQAGDVLTEEEQIAFIRGLVEGAGYYLNSNSVYTDGINTLKYVFTIAGQEKDHPAYNAMFKARALLNKCGFDVTVQNDAQALRKLASGSLTVWAAAWGSTIDPDMYQVYHKDSKATSVLNWGYKQILNPNSSKYAYEKALVEELSELIDEAREMNDQVERAELYQRALDIVMQLAVELPTYQRNDLFAYNTNKIDEGTLTSEDETSPFKGLTSDLHNVSLNVEK